MGVFPRYLCLILALSIVSLSPSADIGAGLSHSSLSRDTKEISIVLQAARRYREAGDFAASEKLYLQGYNQAARQRDEYLAVSALILAANCQLLQFHYRAALENYLEAKRRALSSGDRLNLGAVELSLSNLYERMGDLDSARLSADQARAAIVHVPKTYYKAQLLMQLARLQPTRNDGEAERLIGEGIEAARAQGDAPLEAAAWDLLGQQRLSQGRVEEAARPLEEAFRLRIVLDRKDRGLSYGKLGALKLAQGDLDGAARFTDRAIAEGARSGSSPPDYRLVHQRGQIRLARGDAKAALKDFREAADLSARWRTEVVPAASSLDGANEFLEKRIFDSFVETGAEEAFRRGSSRWARETFQALELNRSQSLREGIDLAESSRERRTPEFWETLSELRSEQARWLRSGAQGSERADRLRLKLTEIEAEMGLGFPPFPQPASENFRSRTSLIHFQDGLGDSELLLSFHLGTVESWVWAMTRKTLNLYRIPSEKRLRSEVGKFRRAIRTGDADPERIGQKLYAELFGGLKASEIRKHAWLLSLDDTLFELPFAALVTGRKDDRVTYLVEGHSLQIVPGALSLVRAGENAAPGADSQFKRWFLGVGDPVYNTADPRWQGPGTDIEKGWRAAGLWSGLIARADTIGTAWDRAREDSGSAAGQLNRLVGSGSEIEASARTWVAHSGTAVLLQGAEAQREKLLGLLAPHPSVIHLATHVIAPPDRDGTGRSGPAFIALTLNSSAQAEFLTTAEVATLHVPGTLVVMTGCDTGAGDARPGAGLLGLTHAWLMAGAGAVLATLWPVKDSAGEMFSTFYANLGYANWEGASAAEALRRSQVKMIRSGTPRAETREWALYQVTGGVH